MYIAADNNILYQSRSPVEALGINIIKSAEQSGIPIHFLPTEYIWCELDYCYGK